MDIADVVSAGRKWIQKVQGGGFVGSGRHKEIVGQVEHGCGGFGLSKLLPTLSKPTAAERRRMVVKENQREEVARCVTAVSQAQQSHWMRL